MKTIFSFILKFFFVSLLINYSASKSTAQVTFLDSSVVTNNALYFWKADDIKPYLYGRPINPHGNCIKTYNGYVFYTWYRGGWDDRTLMVSRKKIGSGTWKHVELRWPGMRSDEPREVQGQLSLVKSKGDTHLTTNIGICPIDGTVHIMYDHHNENLNYIRSKKGIAFGSDADFSKANFLPQQNYLIPGKVVNGVSYPNMFNNDAGEMFFERRLGSAVSGEIVITYYNGTEWSKEVSIIDGRNGVTQGESNFCYGQPVSANGKIYYTYSPRWAESPTILGEGVYVMDLGERMNNKAFNIDGKGYDLPVTYHAPFFIADPRSVPDHYGWAGGPDFTISPKGDVYLKISPKNTPQYNYLRKAGETEFTEYRDKGTLGQFYGNRMYKFQESNGKLYVKSCLAGTFDWRTDYTLNIGFDFDKSRIIMQDGIIAAVYREAVNSPEVPIHCFVFKIEKSEYTPQTITIQDIPEKTEGDAIFALTATATSNLPLVLSSSNPNIARIVEGNKVQIMGKGSCDIIANQAGNGQFDNAPEVKKTLVVKANTAKQNQSLQFSLGTSTYVWGAADINLTATATSSLAVSYESSDTAVAVIVDGKVKVKRAGKTMINALQTGNATYNAAPIVGHELTVPKRPQVITIEKLPTFTSGDKDYTIVATSNNPNATLRYVCPSDQEAIVWDKHVRECLAVGSTTVTVSDEGDEYFLPADATETITVEPKVHTIPTQIEAEYCSKKNGINVARWSNKIFYLNSWSSNDYAEYSINVPTGGVYEVEISAASPATGRKLKLMIGTKTLATATLIKTSTITNFQSTKTNINLTAGVHTLKVVGIVGGFNLDWIKITSNDGGVVVSPGDVEEVEEVEEVIEGDMTVPDYVQAQNYVVVTSDGEQDPNVATNLFDGKIDDENRWSAIDYPKSVVIDLGEEKEIIGTRIWTYQKRAYQYTVEVSNSATDGFVQVVNETSNTATAQPLSSDFEIQNGRYVKLTVTGCHAYTSTWISINEIVLLFNESVEEEVIEIEEEEVTEIEEEEVNENVTNLHDNVKVGEELIRIFPNPTKGSFTISSTVLVNADVAIYSINGTTVFSTNSNSNSLVVPKGKLIGKGIYIIEIKSINSVNYQKLVVE